MAEFHHICIVYPCYGQNNSWLSICRYKNCGLDLLKSIESICSAVFQKNTLDSRANAPLFAPYKAVFLPKTTRLFCSSSAVFTSHGPSFGQSVRARAVYYGAKMRVIFSHHLFGYFTDSGDFKVWAICTRRTKSETKTALKLGATLR